MVEKMKFLGSSKVSTHYRVSIVYDVARQMELKIGDRILFCENEKGEIIIKKA